MMEDPLAALRPLHAPSPVGWWPPALGWWIVVLLVIIGIFLIVRFRRRKAAQRAALRELKFLAKNHETVNNSVALLNQLLKRYALVCWPAKQVASLSGQAWLNFLDANGGNGQFAKGSGQLLLTGPYQKTPGEIDGLVDLVHVWIKTNSPSDKCDV